VELGEDDTVMSTPMISVGMPVYNAGSYLRASLKSLLGQTFQNWELIILDDGSTDDALALNADLLNDPRVRLIQDGQNHGLAARLNQAISLSQGKYFARMDQDDIAYSERLEKQFEALEEHSDWDLLGVRYVTMSMSGEAIGMSPLLTTHEELSAAPWRGFYIGHPTWMGRTQWFRNNLYAQPGPYFCEDQELLLRTYQHSVFACLPEALLAYRLRDRIPWRKTLRTRRTLLGLRIQHFLKTKDYKSLLKSYTNFIFGLSHDLLSQIPGIESRVKNLSARIGQVPQLELLKFQNAIERYENETGNHSGTLSVGK
jgi:glycosyltransferase involved in cell wall biosynthesis